MTVLGVDLVLGDGVTHFTYAVEDCHGLRLISAIHEDLGAQRNALLVT